jgi:hypothetical protein
MARLELGLGMGVGLLRLGLGLGMGLRLGLGLWVGSVGLTVLGLAALLLRPMVRQLRALCR